MTTADEVARFTRERREADQRYNDTLTALDRAVAAASLGPVDNVGPLDPVGPAGPGGSASAVGAVGDEVSTALTSLAHAVNVDALVLNNLIFTHLDYAAIGYRA
jgi:hypothetical protein